MMPSNFDHHQTVVDKYQKKYNTVSLRNERIFSCIISFQQKKFKQINYAIVRRVSTLYFFYRSRKMKEGCIAKYHRT
jgi:hypothetical protein